jgi:hypothetical protein
VVSGAEQWQAPHLYKDTTAPGALLLLAASQSGLLSVWDVGRQQALVRTVPAAQQEIAWLLPVVMPSMGCAAAMATGAGAAAAGSTARGSLAASPQLVIVRSGADLCPLVVSGAEAFVGRPLGFGPAPTAAAVTRTSVAAASSGGRVQVWDVMTGQPLHAMQFRPGCRVTCLCLLPSGILVAGTAAGDLVCVVVGSSPGHVYRS